jgi:hypothetical protein
MVSVMGKLSHWSPWWAESHKKIDIKNLKIKKINTLPTGSRGPPGRQALLLVPVVPVAGRISQKK